VPKQSNDLPVCQAFCKNGEQCTRRWHPKGTKPLCWQHTKIVEYKKQEGEQTIRE